MTVIELARKAGIGPQAIRYYERRGLLPPAHRWADSGYRDFDENALSILRFVHAAKEAGFTLEQTKHLLELRIPPRGSCAEVGAIFEAKLQELDRKAAVIRRMTATLKKMRAACRGRKRSETCLALWCIGARLAASIRLMPHSA